MKKKEIDRIIINKPNLVINNFYEGIAKSLL